MTVTPSLLNTLLHTDHHLPCFSYHPENIRSKLLQTASSLPITHYVSPSFCPGHFSEFTQFHWAISSILTENHHLCADKAQCMFRAESHISNGLLDILTATPHSHLKQKIHHLLSSYSSLRVLYFLLYSQPWWFLAPRSTELPMDSF